MNLVARSERMPAGGGSIQGGSPLAGHLGLPSLLIREAVQNSWDARDGDGPVHFAVEGWDLDTVELDHLRSLLPVKGLRGFKRRSRDDEAAGILHPWAVLNQASVSVLVLSDRNTVGLCGPTRSGQAWEPVRHGEPMLQGQKRFANFVRNQGRAATHIGGGDGGAYGVGKNALWMASSCGTVLVHTRTTDENGDPVERFIGKIHGDYFEDRGSEYSGRHFVGTLADDDLVEPLIGADAAAARAGLPIPTYELEGQQVDGTSIIIVEPRLPLGWPTEMDRIRDAIRWQVWPKRVPGVRNPEAPPDMVFDLRWNNNAVELPEPLEDPEIRPYARALLDCARQRIAAEPERDHVVRCRRPSKDLGLLKFRTAGTDDGNAFHLTITEQELEDRAKAAEISGADHEPAVDFKQPWGQIALVRREPLLLVRYEAIGGPDSAATQIGVFLSAADDEVEEALTLAEPPAHDEWNHKIVPKDHSKDHRRTYAKKTVDEIRSARKQMLSTFRSGEDMGLHGGGEQSVSRRISQGLFGGLGGGQRPKNSNGSASAGGKRPRATLELVRSSQNESHTLHELSVSINGLTTEADLVLTAGGAGYDNSGKMAVDERVAYRWIDEKGMTVQGPTLAVRGSNDTHLSLVVTVDSDLRFRPKVGLEISDGA